MKLTIKPYHPLNVEQFGIKKLSWLRVWCSPLMEVCSSKKDFFITLMLSVALVEVVKSLGVSLPIAVLLCLLTLHFRWWAELLIDSTKYWFKVARFHEDGAVSLSEIQDVVDFTGLPKVLTDNEVVIYAALSSTTYHFGLKWATEYGRWKLSDVGKTPPDRVTGFCNYRIGVVVAQGVSPLDTKLILAHELSHLAQDVHLKYQCGIKADEDCYPQKQLLASKYLADESRPPLTGYSVMKREVPLEWAFGEFEADVFALYTSINLLNLHHDDVEAVYMARYRKGKYHPLHFFSCVYYHQLLTILPRGKGTSWSEFLEMAYDAIPSEKLQKMIEIVHDIDEKKGTHTPRTLFKVFTQQCEALKDSVQLSA